MLRILRARVFKSFNGNSKDYTIFFWLINLFGVVFLWLTTTDFSFDLATVLDAIGMLFGLLATYFALTQFMLMGRIGWIERQFNRNQLARYHRLNGYLAISFIIVHPLFITVSYAIENHIGLLRQYENLIFQQDAYPFVGLAAIAELLFIGVVVSSIYIVRKHLSFEKWYYVHLMVYTAIIIVPLHQVFVGDSFANGEHPLALIYWLGIYGFVGLNIVIWRFSLPIYTFWRFSFVVSELVAETSNATSIYIRGRNLSQWSVIPGQFVMVRFLQGHFWLQEHPFSISQMPRKNTFRLTVRHVGDYTNRIDLLKVGTRVVVDGPFGHFTHKVAQTEKRLYIATGVGITPIMSLIDTSIDIHSDVLMYGNRSEDDVIFEDELARHAKKGLRIVKVFSNSSTLRRTEHGHIDLARIKRLVPDYSSRDIYLCGLPAMTTDIVRALKDDGFDDRQLHYERFSLRAA